MDLKLQLPKAYIEGRNKKKKKTQWTKFTYVGKETRAITKAFKNTNMKITYSTNNTIGKLLMTRRHHTKCKYDECGIHQLKCPTCNRKYIGQTGISFKIRFHEHFRDFKHGNGKSSFAQHLIENGHSIGPMQDIMETVQLTSKGQMMDTLEKFYVFRETKINNQINDRMTVKSNIIFDTIVCNDPHRGLPNTYSA